ncbi:lysozyme inhibitor LprI family protein [Luteimonas sp. e5]
MKMLFTPLFLAALFSCQKPVSQETGPLQVSNGTEVASSDVESQQPVPAYTNSSALGLGANRGQQEQVMLRDSYRRCVDSTDGVTPAIQDCIAKEHEFQDGRLNEVYRKLLSQLDSPGMQKLRQEQRQWLAERDMECDPGEDPGQGQLIDANSCVLNRTAERANELEARLRAD